MARLALLGGQYLIYDLLLVGDAGIVKHRGKDGRDAAAKWEADNPSQHVVASRLSLDNPNVEEYTAIIIS